MGAWIEIVGRQGSLHNQQSLPSWERGLKPNETFDVITARQSFCFFDHKNIMPEFFCMLKPGGSILVLYMAWLPCENEIAAASEKIE